MNKCFCISHYRFFIYPTRFRLSPNFNTSSEVLLILISSLLFCVLHITFSSVTLNNISDNATLSLVIILNFFKNVQSILIWYLMLFIHIFLSNMSFLGTPNSCILLYKLFRWYNHTSFWNTQIFAIYSIYICTSFH